MAQMMLALRYARYCADRAATCGTMVVVCENFAALKAFYDNYRGRTADDLLCSGGGDIDVVLTNCFGILAGVYYCVHRVHREADVVATNLMATPRSYDTAMLRRYPDATSLSSFLTTISTLISLAVAALPTTTSKDVVPFVCNLTVRCTARDEADVLFHWADRYLLNAFKPNADVFDKCLSAFARIVENYFYGDPLNMEYAPCVIEKFLCSASINDVTAEEFVLNYLTDVLDFF